MRADVEWLRTELNPILKGCGWPEVTDEEMDGHLRGNSARLWGLE